MFGLFKLNSSPYGITSNNCKNVVSPNYTAFVVCTVKIKIPGAVLELCQLKLKQFSPDILKFSTKHEDKPFTLNCFMVPRTRVFIFDAGSGRLCSNNIRNSSYNSSYLSVSYHYALTIKPACNIKFSLKYVF